MKLNTLIDNIDELDHLAWNSICSWPSAANFDPVFNGLDLSELTRFFLWDKVGRAIRFQNNDGTCKLERKLLTANQQTSINKYYPVPIYKNYKNWTLLPKVYHLFSIWINQNIQRMQWRSFRRKNKSRICYIPVYSRPLVKLIDALIIDGTIKLVVPANAAHLSGVQVVPPINNTPDLIPDKVILELFDAIIAGLQKQNVVLLKEDCEQLKKELFQLSKDIEIAWAQAIAVQPDMILVHGDNHPPHQYYVFIAQKMGIPAFMLQHGLDCEHFYLDIPYADYLAVWGKERKQRYEKNNFRSIISVTGNPEYDFFRKPEGLNCQGDYWLWVTRPHSPEKCYLPSRNVQEGLDIFNALIDLLHAFPENKLIIKPHPYDYEALYQEKIAKSDLHERVSLSNSPPLELFDNARLVFTEDSTVGLEAMFMGKPLIHVHFCNSPPVMPFCEYNAALPAFNIPQLKKSIEIIINHDSWKDKMLKGQLSFIDNYAYSLDGNSGNRVVNWILESMSTYRSDNK